MKLRSANDESASSEIDETRSPSDEIDLGNMMNRIVKLETEMKIYEVRRQHLSLWRFGPPITPDD